MRMPLDVPPAGPTYVHFKTVSQHFGAETKTSELQQKAMVLFRGESRARVEMYPFLT